MSATRLTVQFTPLPPGFRGDLNKFCRAFVDRLTVLSPLEGLQWVIGGLEPTSNIGPWLNDLGQPFYFSEDLGQYVPLDMTLSNAALQAALDAAIVNVSTNYSTTAQTATAIAAAVAAVDVVPSTHAFSYGLAGAFPVSSTDGQTVVPFTARQFDLGNNVVGGVFTAPVDGIYMFEYGTFMEYISGGTTNINVVMGLERIGIGQICFATNESGSDTRGRTKSLIRRVALPAGGKVRCNILVDASTATGWSVNPALDATFFSGQLVEPT